MRRLLKEEREYSLRVAIDIEEYIINGVKVGVGHEVIVQNGNVICELSRKIKTCRITSTLEWISFCFRERLIMFGDGIVPKLGKIDFFPGVQVSITSLRETINDRFVVDGSISPGGIIYLR